MLRRLLCALGALSLGLVSCAGAEAVWTDWDAAVRIEDSENYLVCRDEKWGVIEASGAVLLEPQFDSEPEFTGELAVVHKVDPSTKGESSLYVEITSLCGAINRDGALVIPVEYDSLVLSDDGRIATVSQNEKYGFIDNAGNEITPLEYDDAGAFTGGYATVARKSNVATEDLSGSSSYDKLWGVIDETGKIVADFQYNEVKLCGNGKAWGADSNWRYYLLDLGSGTVSDFYYAGIGDILNGYSAVRKSFKSDTANLSDPDYDGYWGVVDDNGEVVIPLEYDNIDLCEDGLARVYISNPGIYGYLDMTGETVIPILYERLRPFVGEYAAAMLRESEGWGVINRAGETVLPLEYDAVRVFEDETARAEKDGERTWFDLSGGEAVKIEDGAQS